MSPHTSSYRQCATFTQPLRGELKLQMCGLKTPATVYFAIITLAPPPLKTHAEWQYVFLITASVYMCGAIAYGLMASGERQDWSRIEGEDAG